MPYSAARGASGRYGDHPIRRYRLSDECGDMQISEHLFAHLLAEHDARIARELEQRRVVLERIAEARADAGRVRDRASLTWRRRRACAG